MSGQLYIDGKMSGPSHGDKLPGPVLPEADGYEQRAEIRRGGCVVAACEKTPSGREKIRNVAPYSRSPNSAPWVWRDSLRFVRGGPCTFVEGDRCDGKGGFFW